MSAFLNGMAKSFSIWPKTDYDDLIPKRAPSIEAWANVGKNLTASILKLDRNLETLDNDDWNSEKLSRARRDFIIWTHENLDSDTLDKDVREHYFNLASDKEALKEIDRYITELKQLREALDHCQIEMTKDNDSKDQNR
ncbi:hypothetical protein Q2Y23_002464 [Vibrio fluvialis]|nr:hypothetical protein [Vibrio fluvialis]ELP2652385.1 hypothetical protein [Vibrio fluvialis]